MNWSSPLDRIKSAIRRRFSCVFRSASSLAAEAPTPNMIPAVAGGVIRDNNSGKRSLSTSTHCRNRLIHPLLTKSTRDPKNLTSLNASPISFFHTLELADIFEICCSKSNTVWFTLFGKSRDRSVGETTFVEMLEIALVMRSVSPRAVRNAGNDDVRILSILSGLACGVDEPSWSGDGLPDIPESWDNPIGLLVNTAARRRNSRSCNRLACKIHEISTY